MVCRTLLEPDGDVSTEIYSTTYPYVARHCHSHTTHNFFYCIFVFLRQQCEDRCFRIGQTKEVDVTYHDVPYTIDDIMRKIIVSCLCRS